jgi:membrane-bound metal-dependent hydrolase YbcI (DUF457 family)
MSSTWPEHFLYLHGIEAFVLLLCHLFTGLVVGLVLYKLTGQRWTIFICGLGAVLPDLIDKPLGHILFQGTLDNGRLFAHGLLFLGLVAVVALIYFRSKRSYLLLALALGISLHQLGDSMFLDQVGWFWPAFGPYAQEHFPDYFGRSIMIEIGSLYEWVFGTFSLIIIWNNLHKDARTRAWTSLTSRRFLLTNGANILFFFALMFIAWGMIAWSWGEDMASSGAWYTSAITASAGACALEWVEKE